MGWRSGTIIGLVNIEQNQIVKVLPAPAIEPRSGLAARNRSGVESVWSLRLNDLQCTSTCRPSALGVLSEMARVW
jgi:hypothetical protein